MANLNAMLDVSLMSPLLDWHLVPSYVHQQVACELALLRTRRSRVHVVASNETTTTIYTRDLTSGLGATTRELPTRFVWQAYEPLLGEPDRSRLVQPANEADTVEVDNPGEPIEDGEYSVDDFIINFMEEDILASDLGEVGGNPGQPPTPPPSEAGSASSSSQRRHLQVVVNRLDENVVRQHLDKLRAAQRKSRADQSKRSGSKKAHKGRMVIHSDTEDDVSPVPRRSKTSKGHEDKSNKTGFHSNKRKEGQDGKSRSSPPHAAKRPGSVKVACDSGKKPTGHANLPEEMEVDSVAHCSKTLAPKKPKLDKSQVQAKGHTSSKSKDRKEGPDGNSRSSHPRKPDRPKSVEVNQHRPKGPTGHGANQPQVVEEAEGPEKHARGLLFYCKSTPPYEFVQTLKWWQAWREDGVDVYVPPVKEELKSPMTQQDIKQKWFDQGYRFDEKPSKGGQQKFMIGTRRTSDIVTCPKCKIEGAKPMDRQAFSRHLRTTHSPIPPPCPLCTDEWGNVELLTRHLRNTHGIDGKKFP